jgi:hypothetical protein
MAEPIQRENKLKLNLIVGASIVITYALVAYFTWTGMFP